MNNRTDIYPSIWRVIGIILAGLLLVMVCYLMTIHPRAGIEKFIGYLGVVFFSYAVIIGSVWLILRAMQKPLARIYDDRLEYLIPAKMKYDIIPFLHVEMFVTVKVGAKLIRADYLTGVSKNTGIVNTLVPVGKVCDMLNQRLEKFWAQPMLSKPLNRASVTKYLLTMGIEPWRFDFDTTSSIEYQTSAQLSSYLHTKHGLRLQRREALSQGLIKVRTPDGTNRSHHSIHSNIYITYYQRDSYL